MYLSSTSWLLYQMNAERQHRLRLYLHIYALFACCILQMNMDYGYKVVSTWMTSVYSWKLTIIVSLMLWPKQSFSVFAFTTVMYIRCRLAFHLLHMLLSFLGWSSIGSWSECFIVFPSYRLIRYQQTVMNVTSILVVILVLELTTSNLCRCSLGVRCLFM